MYSQHIMSSIRFTTRHAFWVLTGLVSSALGLRKTLGSGLRIKQKVYQYSPVDKVLQALIASSVAIAT